MLFVTLFQTSVDFLCKTSYKSSSLLGYFDCFQSNHIVGCCNINFSDLSQIRREKVCVASNASTFLLYIFCTIAVVSLQRLANFSPCDPLIFCFQPTRYAHSLLKNEFFSNIHGWFLTEEQRKRNFQANEVSKRRSKKLFFTLFCALNQNFFAVPVRHRSETCKEKASLLLIKKERARRKNCEVFEHSFWCSFPRKVPIFRACKNAKFALQHAIIFGVLASPWTTLKTEKRKFACSWEMKSVSGHQKQGFPNRLIFRSSVEQFANVVVRTRSIYASIWCKRWPRAHVRWFSRKLALWWLFWQ